ncbi:MAG TPA: hypothetical protein PKH40_11985 [Treponemataceae bacterium]|jgi:hypothetical protein|nr:hypothetical protein [Treponemataceae bacterium]HQL34105.1 hypothetical protein [Treponemataceae bacterium]
MNTRRNPRHPRRTFTLLFTLVLTLAAALAASSCSNTADWYPEGSASIQSTYETASSDKQCIITVAIANTGKSKIWRSTVSIAARTNVREYHATVSSETPILPGGTVYASASIPYIDGTETLATTGAGTTGSPAWVTSEFYE